MSEATPIDSESTQTTISPCSSTKNDELSLIEEYLLSWCRQDYISMARAFLKTFPEDEECSSANFNIKRHLLRLIFGGLPEPLRTDDDHRIDPVLMMEYLWKRARLADKAVAHFGLPIPDGQCCIMFDYGKSLKERESSHPNFEKKYDLALYLVRKRMMPEPLGGEPHCYPFPRVEQYLATAIALAACSAEKQGKSLQDILKDTQ